VNSGKLGKLEHTESGNANIEAPSNSAVLVTAARWRFEMNLKKPVWAAARDGER
jgi:hypothetical protein